MDTFGLTAGIVLGTIGALCIAIFAGIGIDAVATSWADSTPAACIRLPADTPAKKQDRLEVGE